MEIHGRGCGSLLFSKTQLQNSISLSSFLKVATMESSAQADDTIPNLEDPDLAEMMWAPFGERFREKYDVELVSYQCFHTGTTTSVVKSIILTTFKDNHQAIGWRPIVASIT